MSNLVLSKEGEGYIETLLIVTNLFFFPSSFYNNYHAWF